MNERIAFELGLINKKFKLTLKGYYVVFLLGIMLFEWIVLISWSAFKSWIKR